MPAKPSYCARASFLSSPLKAFSPVLPSLSGIRSGASQSSEHEFLFCLHSSRASPRHRRVNSGKGSFPHLWGGPPKRRVTFRTFCGLRMLFAALSLPPSLPLSLHSSLLRVARCGEGKQLGELLSAEADGASEASAHLTEQNRETTGIG